MAGLLYDLNKRWASSIVEIKLPLEVVLSIELADTPLLLQTMKFEGTAGTSDGYFQYAKGFYGQPTGAGVTRYDKVNVYGYISPLNRSTVSWTPIQIPYRKITFTRTYPSYGNVMVDGITRYLSRIPKRSILEGYRADTTVAIPITYMRTFCSALHGKILPPALTEWVKMWNSRHNASLTQAISPALVWNPVYYTLSQAVHLLQTYEAVSVALSRNFSIATTLSNWYALVYKTYVIGKYASTEHTGGPPRLILYGNATKFLVPHMQRDIPDFPVAAAITHVS